MYEEANGVDGVRAAARKAARMGADDQGDGHRRHHLDQIREGRAHPSRTEEIRAAVEIATDNLTTRRSQRHALAGRNSRQRPAARSIEHGSFGDEAAYG